MRFNLAALVASACVIGTVHSWKYQGHILGKPTYHHRSIISLRFKTLSSFSRVDQS